jgi:hypothetical protein
MKIGDFVSAEYPPKQTTMQGVLIKDNQDGTIDLQGPNNEVWTCTKERSAVVRDANLLDRDLVNRIRKETGLC